MMLDIVLCSFSSPESESSEPCSKLWPVMFFTSHFGIPELFNFFTTVFCTAVGSAFLVEIRIPREEQSIAYTFKK